MRRPFRVLFATVVASAAVACGLDVIGRATLTPESEDSAVPEASLPEGAALPDADDEGGQIDLPPLPDPLADAGIDASAEACLAACDGGTCDGGFCVIDCSGPSACNTRVTCPPGVPCAVDCTGPSSCSQGVDCTAATACRIDCAGTSSCANQRIACSGSACQVDCRGANSCALGIGCDAGACALGCAAPSACGNAAPICNSDRCTIRCGGNTGAGQGACSQGVSCNATDSCAIECTGRDTCRNGVGVIARASKVDVSCVGRDSCPQGSSVSGGDAGVYCAGQNPCKGRTYCDAGKCTASCNGADFTFCTKSTYTEQETSCKIGAGGCP